MENPTRTTSPAVGKWLCAAACAMALLLTCTPEFDNPLDPDNPDAFTLWYKVLSDPLPDTLHYGASAVFIVNFGDEDGDAVSVTVSGLPPGQSPSIFPSGDATSVSFNLKGDSLAFDSTYIITLSASGEEPVDTLTLRYTLRVADTTRLGGVKKLKIGMWWTETEYDTTDFQDRDSLGLVDTFGTALTESRRAYKVVDTLKRGADLYYVIRKVDTVINAALPKTDTTLVKHSDSAVYFAMPSDSGSDTLFIKFLSLPLTLGRQWTAADTSFDTVFPLIVNRLTFGTVRLWGYSFSAMEAADTVRYAIGGYDYPCFDLTTTDSGYSLLTAFSALVIPVVQTVIADSGDTIGFSRTQASARTLYNTSLTVPLWSHRVTTGLDTNYLDRTSHRYTSRQETFLTMFYDPWRQDTVLTK